MSRHPTRRTFLLSTAVASLGTYVQAGARRPAPADRLRVGMVGIAGMGNGDLHNIAGAGAEIVALCDVHESRDGVGANRKHFKGAKFFTDYRRMIDEGGLDAVAIATPDHTHAPATMAALKAGLHVFCEKPLTHTVQEARLVAETARKMKRVTQMGTQIHAGTNYRRVVELIKAGAIGPVAEVHTWVGVDWSGRGRPAGMPPVPAGLHWDLWQGPAAERPYNPAYLPANWRRYWAYGGGGLADMACHHMDLPFWALDLRHPTRVEADGPPVNEEGCPLGVRVRYDFPARGALPAVRLTWYDGPRRPELLAKLPERFRFGAGNLFVGAKGMLVADYNRRQLLPERDFADFAPPAQTIANSVGHYKEWVDACKTGGTTTCNFDYSGALTEAVLLGTVSFRAGKALTWDARNLRTGDDAADRLLRKAYRRGWEV